MGNVNLHVWNFRKKREEKVQVFPDKGIFRIPDMGVIPFRPEESFILQQLEELEEGKRAAFNWRWKEEVDASWWQEGLESSPLSASELTWRVLPNETDVFHLLFEQPSLFVFSWTDGFWRRLQDLLQTKRGHHGVWIQLLLEKTPNSKWREVGDELYDRYEKGIDRPSLALGIKQIQDWLSEWGREDWKPHRKRLPHWEEKREGEGFKVSLRFLVTGGDDASRSALADTLYRAFRFGTKGNNWTLLAPPYGKDSQKELVQFARFPLLFGRYQWWGTHELLSFLNGFSLPVVTKQEIMEVKPQETRRETILKEFAVFPRGKERAKPILMDVWRDKWNTALDLLGVTKGETFSFHQVKQGPTISRFECELPKGFRVSTLTKALEDVKTALGLHDLHLEPGDKPNTFWLSVSNAERIPVMVRDVGDRKEFQAFQKEAILPFIIGAGVDGKPLFGDVTQEKHMLVVGATGSGKSMWLLQFILMMILFPPAAGVQLLLVDPKLVEFGVFRGFPNVKVVTDPSESLDTLPLLVDEMERRYQQMSKAGVRNIAQYNRKAKQPLPYIVTVIDEYSDLMMQDPEGVLEPTIVRITQKARGAGIHLVLATQRPEVKVVTGLIKSNIPTRIVFACSGRHDYATVLDHKPPFDLLGKGDGVIKREGQMGLTRFQGALIAETEEKTDSLIQSFKPSTSKPVSFDWLEPEEEDSFRVPETPLELLQVIIAQTGETRVSQVRKLMKMRMNDVQELMRELVEKGWLEEPKSRTSGYTLLLSEEERMAFLEPYSLSIRT
ncbi:FtsK/SpoIIIE domain-containing protein [Cytobacillus sp. FJAT-54145]|uniref:FtsK/SpoIIIE domain-containing protein n=1 Tax=Cytobacillus spartinae TaxID=3299023 RepID=A0ABW6K9Y2_9BACI